MSREPDEAAKPKRSLLSVLGGQVGSAVSLGDHRLALALAVVLGLGLAEGGLSAAHWLKRNVQDVANVVRGLPAEGTAPAPAPASAPDPGHIAGPTDEFPFRSPVAGVVPGVPRIWISSASHGDDGAYAVTDIFPNLVCGKLNANGQDSICLNASRAGQPILGNAERLRQEGARWAPDVAVLYQLSLDLQGLINKHSGYAAVPREGASPQRIQERAPLSANLNAILRRPVEQTWIYRDGREFIGSTLLMHAPLSKLAPVAESEFRAVLDSYIDAALEVGATPVLCTFALSHDTRNAYEMSYRTRTWLMLWQTGLSPYRFVSAIDVFNAIIRDVAVARRVVLADVAVAVGGRPEFFRDPVHFNRDGHMEVANVIVDALEASGVLPPRIED